MEMNIFCPQSIEAQFELEEIADLKFQIISPQSSAPIISMKQDQLLGAYNLTSEYYKIGWQTAMNLLTSATLNSLDGIPKNHEFTGKELYSYLIPENINLLKGNFEDPNIYVRNGVVEKGRLGKESLGVKQKNNLFQLVWDEYGVEATRKFLDNTSRVINNFNMFNGFSVGTKDLEIKDELYYKIQQIFETKKLEIQHEITEVENNPDMINKKLFEKLINQKLSVIREDVSKFIMANMPLNNNFRIMVDSGSKGSAMNIVQMIGLVGQQDYHDGRMQNNYNDRSLPYFFKNDDRAEARGFIERPFMRGLNLTEFIFHHLSAREGLIDQTVRSVTGDTKIIIIENSKPKTVEIGPWIDNYLENAYKIKPEEIEHDKNNFELLKVDDIFIPTVDDEGKVFWGTVSAVTRHDPGQQLFEIVTKSGRRVKVPESKSLLIWNVYTNKFEPKLTN